MKKLVIFDLDGTLVDSIYDLADCVNQALRAEGLPENELGEYYAFVGKGMENLIRCAMKDRSCDEPLYKAVRSRFDALYAEHSSDKTVPYEGVEDLLCKFNAQGISTAVLSNKAHEFVSGILRKCFPDHSFLYAWGNFAGIPRKPDPAGLLRLVDESGFDLSECVYVGDSEVDVDTARNAGMDLVCVDWGFRSRETLIDAGAECIASTADELYFAVVSM